MRVFKVDPIIAIFVSFIMTLELFLELNIVHICLVLILFVYLSLQGLFREALRNLIVYAIVYFLMYLCVYYSFAKFFSFIVFFVIRLYPLIMAVALVKSYTPKGIVLAFTRMKLPRNIILSFMIMIRFMPTLKFEFLQIIDSMHLRNLSFRSGYGFIHPFKTIRNILVPLLFRCLKISEELGTAAMFRGIDAPIKRTDTNYRKLRFIDYSVAILFVLVYVSTIVIKTNYMSLIY